MEDRGGVAAACAAVVGGEAVMRKLEAFGGKTVLGCRSEIEMSGYLDSQS